MDNVNLCSRSVPEVPPDGLWYYRDDALPKLEALSKYRSASIETDRDRAFRFRRLVVPGPPVVGRDESILTSLVCFATRRDLEVKRTGECGNIKEPYNRYYCLR
jgi:hypothetical protein